MSSGRMQVPLILAVLLVLVAVLGIPSPAHGEPNPRWPQNRFNLPAGLSDPDARGASVNGGGDGAAAAAIAGATEHGDPIRTRGSAVAIEVGDVKAKEWEMKHGLVDDPETVVDGLQRTGPYGFKRVTTLNTDTAVRRAMSPEEYDRALSRGEMDPADLRGEHKYVDSTIPSSSDPASRAPAKNYDPGDPRLTLYSLAPSDRYRGEHDPEAKEIVRRNKKSNVHLSIFSVPEHLDVPIAPRGSGKLVGSLADWSESVRGRMDTVGSKVTDPKILETVKDTGVLDHYTPSSADPGTNDGSLKGAPTFDEGIHAHRSGEFSNPEYHQEGVKTRYVRPATDVPADPKEPNYQGLAMNSAE